MVKRTLYAVLKFFVLGYLTVVMLFGCAQRHFLYYPTHQSIQENQLKSYNAQPWVWEGKTIGYQHAVAQPRQIWFMLQGNGGEAASRLPLINDINPRDAFYILEYPGYGQREGKPTQKNLNAVALQAYQILVQKYGADKITLLGESLGSGVASYLASQQPAPARVVLVVPYDDITDVAQEALPWLPAKLIMLDRWNNIEALSKYSGKIYIFGARNDTLIPVHHARNLAQKFPHAHYTELDAGHNSWSKAADLIFSISPDSP